jgi:hypothetical protein
MVCSSETKQARKTTLGLNLFVLMRGLQGKFQGPQNLSRFEVSVKMLGLGMFFL